MSCENKTLKLYDVSAYCERLKLYGVSAYCERLKLYCVSERNAVRLPLLSIDFIYQMLSFIGCFFFLLSKRTALRCTAAPSAIYR
jgi:hypothetical protein